jgi:hypothetical protein
MSDEVIQLSIEKEKTAQALANVRLAEEQVRLAEKKLRLAEIEERVRLAEIEAKQKSSNGEYYLFNIRCNLLFYLTYKTPSPQPLHFAKLEIFYELLQELPSLSSFYEYALGLLWKRKEKQM